jgi:hypothetical protein
MELEPEGPDRKYTAPGDITYFLRGPSLLGSQKDYDPEFQRKLCEFAIFYGLPTGSGGDPGRMMDSDKYEIKPEIPRSGVFFAHFEKPIPEDFFLKAESIRHGRKKLIIRRYEG